jgi:nucleotide-binding universal stress UspA family protein
MLIKNTSLGIGQFARLGRKILPCRRKTFFLVARLPQKMYKKIWEQYFVQRMPSEEPMVNKNTKEHHMPEIKKILVAVDLSPQSVAVAEYAVCLAGALNAEILAVYIAPSLGHYVGFQVPTSSIENFVGEVVNGAEKSMSEFVRENFKGARAAGKVISGYAAEEIINQAKENGADLIVMGTHGRAGLDRILFGSVAEKVVKTSYIPVLTVRPEQEAEAQA